ncbi:hypothetical protein PRUPE_4G239000 [Prunus persica]|uniref:Uncharacterized protein n=1 Tax=Prunus persica TaxID=3760 RepID=M5WMQ4_PRUPE|nr:hypothetical protein PRUPE_4G239000 [Prunus persica]
MKSLQVFFMLAMLIMALAITISVNKPVPCLSVVSRETEGSAGPDCRNKKCVDMRTDISNCGSCGKRCSSSEICCNAHCVNPMSH